MVPLVEDAAEDVAAAVRRTGSYGGDSMVAMIEFDEEMAQRVEAVYGTLGRR